MWTVLLHSASSVVELLFPLCSTRRLIMPSCGNTFFLLLPIQRIDFARLPFLLILLLLVWPSATHLPVICGTRESEDSVPDCKPWRVVPRKSSRSNVKFLRHRREPLFIEENSSLPLSRLYRNASWIYYHSPLRYYHWAMRISSVDFNNTDHRWPPRYLTYYGG